MYVAFVIVGEFETNFPTHREVGRKPGGVGKGHPAFFMAQIKLGNRGADLFLLGENTISLPAWRCRREFPENIGMRGPVGGVTPAPPSRHHALKRRRRKELVTTDTELRAMAAAARAGFRVQPQSG